MTNVVELGVVTTQDHPPDWALQKALDARLELAIVVGVKDGELFFSSNKADGGEVLWWLEKAKKALLDL